MAKDPAVLFYTSDFLSGTFTMTNEQVGKYIRLLCIQHQRGYLTEKDFQHICGQYDDEIMRKFEPCGSGYINRRMSDESEKRSKYVESRRNSRKKSDEDSVRVYIVRDNLRSTYKIGSSVNPLRRYNELMFQKSPAIIEDEQGQRDLTLLWYSEILPRTEEKVLHEKYAEKNIKGEWFCLNEADLNEIFSTYDGTYVNRTTPRTEDENENENITVLKGGEGGKMKKPTLQEVTDHFTEKGHPQQSEIFFNYYESNGWKVGKNPMKNWKAAAQNWIKNIDRYGTTKQNNGQGIGKNDYKSAAAQYDFTKYGNTPVGQIFNVVG